MNRWMSIFVMMAVGTAAFAADNPPGYKPPPQAALKLKDQFDQQQDLANLRGDVVVILYGDKQGMESNRDLGEKLHVHYHPTAKGMKPLDAAKAPVVALAGAPAGVHIPNVVCVPVACIYGVPELGRGIPRAMVKAKSDVPVWLDFDETMKNQFGMKEGVPNLLVIDAGGRLRYKVSGELDAPTNDKLVKIIDYLRTEAVKPR